MLIELYLLSVVYDNVVYLIIHTSIFLMIMI